MILHDMESPNSPFLSRTTEGTTVQPMSDILKLAELAGTSVPFIFGQIKFYCWNYSEI